MPARHKHRRLLTLASALGRHRRLDGATRPELGSASTAGFPAPPSGAIVYSRELGADALALGVVPQGRRVLLQASVLGSQGEGVPGLSIAFSVHGAVKAASACGPGCYRATMASATRPASVEVDVKGTQRCVAMPAAWPPPDGSALLARAGRVWRSLRSLSYWERIASAPGEAVTSTWQVQAPNRLAYQVVHKGAAVIVGDRRCHGQHPLGRVRAAAADPARAVLGLGRQRARARDHNRAGPPAWRVSFFDPGTPA